MSKSEHTFLWHDYETFGVNPKYDRPAQFAAIRTDCELNEIGEPIMLYCQPAPDYLPDPQACLITGITPQICLERGLPEHEFAAAIHAAFSEPHTVGVGYNTIRFDDEVTRFLFWRNLFDPYAREWQNNCGRWDILDMVRTAYALRPDGMVWPRREDGKPSFRLEHLTAANGLAHEAAHDALSDVRATIALARLLRQNQPKLFDFCLELRKKEKAAAEIGLAKSKPFLHVSGMFGTDRGCMALMWPLAVHPSNKNEVIAWDLAHDPSLLLDLGAEEIRMRLFSKADSLPAQSGRLPIKTIHINKSPVVIGNIKTLSREVSERWKLDLDTALRHAGLASSIPELCAHLNTDMAALWREVYRMPRQEKVDVDQDLYGGFIGSRDRQRLDRLRQLPAEQLALERPRFDDGRLEQLVFRYRARNFPETLSVREAEQWDGLRAEWLFEGAGKARTMDQFFADIDRLHEDADDRGQEILSDLYDYGEAIAPVRRMAWE